MITVEEAKGMETYVDVVEGMQFDRGYLSPYFVTDADKMIADLENPYILLFDKKISNLHEILPILEPVAQSGALINYCRRCRRSSLSYFSSQQITWRT